MKNYVHILLFLITSCALAQQIAPSNNRSIVGLEKNMLFNAKSRFTVTQTGTATLDLPTLFDGKMAPSYTNTAPSVSNPTVVLIENLPNEHIQAGAWIGWTTRYWAPKKFKIEGYNVYDNTNTWVMIADINNYTNFDYILAVPYGSFTKFRFTFYEGTGTNGLLGISEIFFLHPEAVAAYDGLSVQYNPNGNVGIGTASPASTLHIGSSNKEIRFDYNGTDNYFGSLRWAGLQLGNNGDNRIIAGRNSTGGNLSFYVNNTNDAANYTIAPNGILAMKLASNGNVGIGVTAPNKKLVVQGEIGFGYPDGLSYNGMRRNGVATEYLVVLYL